MFLFPSASTSPTLFPMIPLRHPITLRGPVTCSLHPPAPPPTPPLLESCTRPLNWVIEIQLSRCCKPGCLSFPWLEPPQYQPPATHLCIHHPPPSPPPHFPPPLLGTTCVDHPLTWCYRYPPLTLHTHTPITPAATSICMVSQTLSPLAVAFI